MKILHAYPLGALSRAVRSTIDRHRNPQRHHLQSVGIADYRHWGRLWRIFVSYECQPRTFHFPGFEQNAPSSFCSPIMVYARFIYAISALYRPHPWYACTQDDQIHGGKEYSGFALSPNLVVAWMTRYGDIGRGGRHNGFGRPPDSPAKLSGFICLCEGLRGYQ